MTERLKQFIQDNRDLINENTKDSWEEIYKKLFGLRREMFIGEFTECFLNIGIDPVKFLGYMPEFYLEGSKITEYSIPDNINIISKCAFYDCSSLIAINIPNNIDTIKKYAFSGCINLKNIFIPDSVVNIENGTFYGCEKLSRVSIPDIISNIYGDCRIIFKGCSKLKEIHYRGTMKPELLNLKGDKKSLHIICNDGVM